MNEIKGMRLRWSVGGLLLTWLTVAFLALMAPAWAQSNDRSVPPEMPTAGNVPGAHLGTSSDAEIWRAVRHGIQGNVSIPNKTAGMMIQSQGDEWRAFRTGPLVEASAWILLGMIGLLALFFVIRGRIKVDSGFCGRTIERFNELERIAHWLTASSFILLALTGLNMLFGRTLLMPILGPALFANLTIAGKYAHNFLAFGFMLGLVMMLVLWIRHNLPNRYDLVWIAYLGGMFSKGVHPPARKFNFGQKLIFWAVILGGASLGASGLALMFPFELTLFESTFGLLNLIGLSLPTSLTPVQEMQLNQIWHALVGVVLIAIVVAHIYIGSLGMQGAFDAMGSGYVDENWAREHHNVWVAETRGEPIPDPDDFGHPQAAE